MGSPVNAYQEDVGAMVTLTRTATEKVQDFIQEHGVEGPVGLRVAVLPGGCSGFQYGLNIETALKTTTKSSTSRAYRSSSIFQRPVSRGCRDRLCQQHDGSGIHVP